MTKLVHWTLTSQSTKQVSNLSFLLPPARGTIYIGLHHLPHVEKQTLPVKLQNVFNSFKLSRYSLLLCAKSQQAFSVSVTIYQNKIFVFAVAPTDAQAQIPLKHCFHQHTSPACIVSKLYSFINFMYVPYLLQLSIGYVMHFMFHQLSHIQSAWQGHGVSKI